MVTVTEHHLNFFMKRLSILLLCLFAFSPVFTSCTTTNNDDARAEGISGQGVGMTRDDVYKWQDKTFRSLAY